MVVVLEPVAGRPRPLGFFSVVFIVVPLWLSLKFTEHHNHGLLGKEPSKFKMAQRKFQDWARSRES
jgi:hypothetical protein